MAFLLVAAHARGELEPAIEGGEQVPAFGGAYLVAKLHALRDRRVARVASAVVQHIPDRAAEHRDVHLRSVGRPHPVDADPRRLRLRLRLRLWLWARRV